MPTNYVLPLQVAFSIVVIAVFGYRQFNRWTDGESRGETSDSELLAYAPPRSFTSLWRFMSVASLYCLTLIVLYLLLFVVFASAPSAGSGFLNVSGVTPENAWLIALFIVTGLSPILPVFSNIEHAIREVMHAWAVVPTKAQQMAEELASPSTTFEADEAFLRDTVLPRIEPEFGRRDFAEGPAVTIAQKWCRLQFLLHKFAPPSLYGSAAQRPRSPYITRFLQDIVALDREVRDFARSNEHFLRTRGGSPAAVALSERIDSMLHRLYVLMCCNAFAAVRSLDEVIRYFQRSYGIGVGSVQLTSIPTDPIFDTLMAVAATVLVISLVFLLVHQDGRVHPFVWSLSALCTHGAGLFVGWFVFGRRRQQLAGSWRDTAQSPLSRKHFVTCVVLGFAVATFPAWAASLYYLLHLPPGHPAPQNPLYMALVVSWPWAFLGSATAAAAFTHLERTANGVASLHIRLWSAGMQAVANVSIALAILAFYSPSGLPPRTLQASLVDPVIQLVLVLTGAIGIVLGFFLPRVVHGHGLDRRGGAKRYQPPAEEAPATFTYFGQQLACKVQTISLTGCVLQLPGKGPDLTTGRNGVLTLQRGAISIAGYVVRAIEDAQDDAAEDRSKVYALQFVSRQRPVQLAPELRQRLSRYLGGAALVSVP